MGSRVVGLVALVLLATAATYGKGVDVSNYQGSSIDWLQVSSGGYGFAFAKASEGTTFTDVTYALNRGGTGGVGMRIGAYHFARPSGSSDAQIVASAIAQADHFADVAQPRGGDLPPALDLETNGGLKAPALVTWTQTWLDQVQARTGASAVIYASPSFWKTSLGDTTAFALASHRLWVAHWTKASSPLVPAANWSGAGWTFWQWSDCQSVPGIPTRCVDADRVNAADPTPLALGALPGGGPAPSTPPAVVGTPRAGFRLAAVPGGWTGGKPVTFAYQWESCTSATACTPIPGATLETYTAGGADVGRTVRVTVTATSHNLAATASSPQTPPIAAANGVTVPVATAAPAIAGTLQVGQTLSASTGSWSGNPAVYAYAWQRCDATGAACAPIADATGPSYTPTPGDLGAALAVVVTATNAGGPQSASSPPTAAVAPAPVPAASVGSFTAVAGQAGAVATTDGTAVVSWQPGAVPTGAVVALSNAASTVQLAITPAVKLLAWPVDVALPTAGLIAGFSTDGRIWTPVTPVTEPTLPAGVNVGTYDGHILTRRAGSFRLFQPNAWGDPRKVSRYAPRLRRVAPIVVQRLRSGALVVSTRLTTPSQVLVVPSRRRVLAPGSFPVKLRVRSTVRRVHVTAIDPWGRRGGFTLSFRVR